MLDRFRLCVKITYLNCQLLVFNGWCLKYTCLDILSSGSTKVNTGIWELLEQQQV